MRVTQIFSDQLRNIIKLISVYGVLAGTKAYIVWLIKYKLFKRFFKQKVTKVKILHKFSIVINLDCIVMPYYFFKKFTDYKFVPRLLPKVGVLDCGAHIGLFSLAIYYFSKKYFPDKKINFICIEPVRENFILLKSNLKEITTHKIKLLRRAITDQTDSKIRIFLSHSVAHSIFINNSGKYEVVRTISFKDLFDQYKDNVDLIKIDVEGAEKYLLNVDIPKNIRVVIIEWHKWCGVKWSEFQKYFRKQGFKKEIITINTQLLKVAYFIR